MGENGSTQREPTNVLREHANPKDLRQGFKPSCDKQMMLYCVAVIYDIVLSYSMYNFYFINILDQISLLLQGCGEVSFEVL